MSSTVASEIGLFSMAFIRGCSVYPPFWVAGLQAGLSGGQRGWSRFSA